MELPCLLKIKVTGIVQGVGFRPFVYRLASELGLKGWVRNTSEGVEIEIEGEQGALDEFLRHLRSEPPSMAHIEHIEVSPGEVKNYKDFVIKKSSPSPDGYQLISPDIATCQDCLLEIFDPHDRRYRYPFTNCTNCGPRFTVLEDLPYDRARTTMRHFKMCPECQREYDDPLSRRFHAQPNACPACGPQLELVDSQGRAVEGDQIAEAARLLGEGKVLAVKGLGGFLLACDATNEEAVNSLRRRKKRPGKPFALMVSDITEAEKLCVVLPLEKALLLSSNSPIVLLEKKEPCPVAPSVAPGLKYLGLMLPYTPLHHLLLREAGLPLVMTSGNLSEEPIISDNDEALRRLSGIADFFLLHNREIASRYDDSVAMVEDNGHSLVRRARGYAPYPIKLAYKSKSVLACGGQEKNTFCLSRDNFAFVSQHIGDLDNFETLAHFEETISLYERLFRLHPEIIACDMHPDYLSTRWAKEQQLECFSIQHHQAHVVSCMVDNNLKPPVIGVAFDGTGYGSDGKLWGGEFMVADYSGFKRAFHLEYLPLPGGEAAIKKPYRIAIGYLYALFGEKFFSEGLPPFEMAGSLETRIVEKQVEASFNTPLTSSFGRLFDGVSALIGLRGEIEYEAQAAIDLEVLASTLEDDEDSYEFELDGDNIRVGHLLREIVDDLKRGVPRAKIAIKFHNGVARLIGEACSKIASDTGLDTVVLSGGCFQNRILLRKSLCSLRERSLKAFIHHQVPCNDGGLSLGQAAIANFLSGGS